MKLTNVKAMVAKSLTVGLLAGAFVLAAPAKADAQQFAIGVQFGSPAYSYNNYRDSYARQRAEQIRRQQEFEAQQAYERQQAWEREHAYGSYGYVDQGRSVHYNHRSADRDRW